MTKLKQKLEQSDIRLQQFQVCQKIFNKNFIFIYLISRLMIRQ
jgi:hypothetical protein